MTSRVLSGAEPWAVEQADCLSWLAALPEQSVDLVFGSPPYEAARTYGIDFKLRDQAWVDWMVKVYLASLRVSKGLVAFVLEGQTRGFRWSAVPALLMADLHRAGVRLRKPPAYCRVGIAGSGGPDWLRNDYEFIVCATPGKLPWSENTACGHKPKWAPGGEMSHRRSDGARVNQWGMNGSVDGGRGKKSRKSQGKFRPSHTVTSNRKLGRATRGHAAGDTVDSDSYNPPAIANPGNLIRCKVGGGLMGSKLCHENEAPFPEALAEFFVRSFCPPGGIVADCFAGSGTTLAVAHRWGRRAIGCDVRQSQVALTIRRLEAETPLMPMMAGG